jgi:Flp pilus assembly protein CpaB
MRAYTINAKGVASNSAGFVLPGNRVDILLHLRGTSNDDSGGGSTSTLLPAVEVLAVGKTLNAPTENRVDASQSVTLLVTPEQATLLDLGNSAKVARRPNSRKPCVSRMELRSGNLYDRNA